MSYSVSDTTEETAAWSVSRTQLGWFQVIKGYLPQQLFLRAQGFDARYYAGERWTSQLITFFWTQSHNLWKDRCASAHATAADTLDKSSARTRQTAHHRVKMAYAHGPLMLALDRRIFDTPLGERLRSRISDLVACTKRMFPVIHHSISEARAQNTTGHHDILNLYLLHWHDSGRVNHERDAQRPDSTGHSTVCTNSRVLAVQQLLQHARTQTATISRDILPVMN
jgi:hypothetical protein